MEEKPPAEKAKAGSGETFMCMVCGTKVPSDAKKCRICGTIFLDEAKVGTVRGLPVAKVSHPSERGDGAGDRGLVRRTEEKGAGEPQPAAMPSVPLAFVEPPATETGPEEEPLPEVELPTMQFVPHRRAPLKKKHETKKS